MTYVGSGTHTGYVQVQVPHVLPACLMNLPCAPATDRLLRIDVPLPDEVMQQVEEPHTCEDQHFEAYLHYLCNFHRLLMLTNTNSALQLYHRLLPFIS